ncbi:hypothetical protein MRB53_037682 [Persea americana]|nr:hypothetical protein MRB53_037682 [Persea americana]
MTHGAAFSPAREQQKIDCDDAYRDTRKSMRTTQARPLPSPQIPILPLSNGTSTRNTMQMSADLRQSYNNPTQIFADDVTEEKGENARLSAFVGAIAVGDLVKSTLGPKGMDKILQSA